MNRNLLETALAKINQNPELYADILASQNKSIIDILSLDGNLSANIFHFTRGFSRKILEAKLNAVLNKCQKIIPE